MARATSKTELIETANLQFVNLFRLIDAMTPEQQNKSFNFEDRDHNLRDVLVHLYEWHQLLLKWVRDNTNGASRSFLPEPYNWKTYPEMNVKFWENHQTTSLSEAKILLKQSHEDVINLIKEFSDEQLFTKKYYKWTGTTTLGAYCVSVAPSHYDWAKKKISNHLRTI